MEYVNPAGPLLIYQVIGGDWVWGGALAANANRTKADEAAAWVKFAWDGVTQAEPGEIAGNIRSIALVAEGEIEMGVEGLRRPRQINYVPGLKIRLIPVATARAAPALEAYRSVVERGGWAPPDDTPARTLYRALERVSHSAVHSKEDANRAMRLSNVAFERDGSDILVLTTDGHRLTLHRLVGFAKYVSRLPKADTIVPIAELKALLPKLKTARNVQIDLSSHEGEPQVYNYGFQGSYGPALADAFSGAIVIDGESFHIPVVKHEFLEWRHVFPKPEWNVTVDSGELLAAISDLYARWSETMKNRPKRSGKKEPSGRLQFDRKSVHIEITPDIPGKPETCSATLLSSGISQNRPARFYMNFRYLRDALRLLHGPVVIAGENGGTNSIDGNSYLVKPVSLLDPSGPTEILIMPMHPPR